MKGVYDTKGNEWVISKGDKAADVVRRCEAKGYQYIVLPARVLAGVPTQEEDWISESDLFNTLDVKVLRQADIMQWLEKQGEIQRP